MTGQRFTHGCYYLITVNLLTQCFNYEMGVLLVILTGILAVSIAKVEFLSSQAFGNVAQADCQAATTAGVVAA